MIPGSLPPACIIVMFFPDPSLLLWHYNYTYIASHATDAESGDCEDINLPISTIATIFIPTTIAMCIISCVIGAFFYCTLSSLSCRRAVKKGQISPRHCYDKITLNTHVQSAPGHPSSSTSHTTADMEMCANEAYIHVHPIA